MSVVIPTYNRARDLERALRSVQAQTYPRWEAIVVDSQSTDGTEEMIRRLADDRVRYINIVNDGVIAASRNVGIRNARGEYVAFLDSDDWWTAGKLDASVRALERGADLVYHDLYRVTSREQRRFRRTARTRAVRRPVFDDLLRRGNAITNSSVVVRAELLARLGGLAEDRPLIAIEDYDAWLRLAKLTDRFERLPGVLGFYWAGGGTITNPRRTIENLTAIAEKYAAELDRLGGAKAVGWLAYVRGKAHYQLGDVRSARAELARVVWGSAPADLVIKARMLVIGSRIARRGARQA